MMVLVLLRGVNVFTVGVKKDDVEVASARNNHVVKRIFLISVIKLIMLMLLLITVVQQIPSLAR